MVYQAKLQRQWKSLWEMKNNRLIIIGASGHGKVVADIAKLNGYTNIAFLDDDSTKKECAGYPVIGAEKDAYGCNNELKSDFFVAIGNSKIRERIQQALEEAGLNVITLIHPSAVVAEDISIGSGTVLMAGTVVNPGTSIDKGCIINTGATVDHDNVINDYVHISVGAHLAGTVELGKHVWVGAGTVISNNIAVISDTVIGAGAVVIDNIKLAGTYIGVPAKRMDRG